MQKVEEDIRPAIADVYWNGMLEGWIIHRINVPAPARGKGHGTTLLKQICGDADAEGLTLMLAPEPSGGLEYADLVAWYRRYGFEFSTAGYVMERKPR